MNTQANFNELPNDPTPFNRRVYQAAKAPFAKLWWVASPFAWAIAVAMALSFGMTVWLGMKKGTPLFTAQVATDILTVGLVWTLYIGVVFLGVKVVARIFDFEW